MVPSDTLLKMRVLFLALPCVLAAANVEIPSSLDGARQPALVDLPTDASAPVPLLVHLHSWSSRFDNSNNLDDIRAEARQRGWAFVSPDFRGVNDHPEACGSELAVQDVLDAVEYMKTRTRIDERRIYLAGSSGGGYMALMMAGRAPHVWAAVSAWVPISDLAAWHEFSTKQKSRYAKMIEGCFGAAPTHGNAAQQVRRRSPVTFLNLAQGLPLDINTGIRDGHEGSVPVSHSLRAFNVVATPVDRIAERDIETLTREPKVPPALATRVDEKRAKTLLFRRRSGKARVTIFDGAHEADFPTAVRWLEQFKQPETAIITALQNDQLLSRQASTVPTPITRGPGTLMVRINNGAWQTTMPKLAAGGPYTIEFKLGTATVKRTNILVGDIYLLAGQSNMVGRAPMVDLAPPDPRVRVYTPEDTWAIARDPIHEAIPRDGRIIGIGLALPFAKEMVRRTGIPVALVPCAIGGTSLEQWNPSRRGQLRRSLYGNFIARGKAVGPAKAVLWYQGEADASRMDTAHSYTKRFEAWVKQMRTDLGPLPLYYAQLARDVVPADRAPGWDTIREAQRLMEPVIAPGGMVATVDLTLTDPIHLDRAAHETLGRRFASRILDGPAPALKSAEWDGPGRLRLKFTKKVTAPKTRIHGFELGEPAVFHATQEASTGDILLLVGPAKSNELYYCRGVNPVCEIPDLPAFGPVTIPARP